MITGHPVHTRVERHGNHRNRVIPRTASSLCYFQRNLQPIREGPAGDVNISGVDFWHAVEFSRNGHFLRTAFQRTLRAFRSFVFPAYQTRVSALRRPAFSTALPEPAV